MEWFWLSLVSVFSFAAQDLLMRVIGVRTQHPRLASFVFNSYGALLACLAFALSGASFESLLRVPNAQGMLIIFAVLLYAVYERIQFVARKGIEASTLSILFQLYPVIGFVGSLIFLGESVSPTKLMGALLAMGASFLLVYKNPKIQFTKAFWVGLSCAALIGVASFVDKPAAANIPTALYSAILWTAPLVVIAYPGMHIAHLKNEYRKAGWSTLIAAGLNVLGFLSFIRAITLTDASRVIPIIATSTIFVVLGGALFLGERDHMIRKIFAALVATVGIALLS